MAERNDDFEGRLAARFRSYLTQEAPESQPRVMASRAIDAAASRRSWVLAVPGAVGTVIAVGVLILAIGLVRFQPPAASSGPSSSPPASALVGSPAPSQGDGLTSWYPDGLPRTINGEPVYRATDSALASAGGSVLVAGWTVSWTTPHCLPNPPLPSGARCPGYTALADAPDGPVVLLVEPTGTAWPPTGVVVRVVWEPKWHCPDTVSCVAPIAWGMGLVWQINPDATPLPSGGITMAQAVALAREHVWPSGTFLSVAAGPFAQLDLHPNQTGPGSDVKPTELVWAVRFAGEFTICPPNGGPCESPRPGISVVYLDYATGRFLMSEGFSPSP